jgi:hypothetical protein
MYATHCFIMQHSSKYVVVPQHTVNKCVVFQGVSARIQTYGAPVYISYSVQGN